MTEAELGMAAAGGILGGMVSTVIICALVVYVLLIVAEWKIFTKAGEAGWKSLIPIYNLYILYKIVGLSFLTWCVVPFLCVPFVLGFLSGMFPALQSIVSICSAIIEIVASIKLVSAMGDAFGKGTGFKVGLFFFPNIFTLILGFGSAEYVGPANK